MDDSQNLEVEVDNISTAESLSSLLQEGRRHLNSYSNRLRPLRDKLERLLTDDDPVELDLDELQEAKDTVAMLKNKATKEMDVLYQDETDEARWEGDEATWMALQELMRRVSSLSVNLVSIKVAQSWVKDVDEQLDELIAQAAANPEMDFTEGIAGLTHSNTQLKVVLRKSTIPENHNLRKVAKEMNGRIILLMATKKVESAGGVAGGVSDVKPHVSSAYKLPKFELPKFDGNLEKWNGFWVEFEEAVHNNESLSQTQKLTYLRQCIVSPSLKELLLPTSKDPGVYAELVAMLKRGYDKPRKLHQLHSRTLAELPVCRNTAEDLLAGGDRLHKAVAGLVDLGKADVHSIGTSLGVSTLPPILQTEWETLTQEQEKVPPVDELIAFMRQSLPISVQWPRRGILPPSQRSRREVGHAHF